MTVSLMLGDNALLLKTIKSETVDLTVTSPPYDDLRTYEGFSFDFEPLVRELFRVTKPGGVVVWNVADATKNGSESGTSFRQALGFMAEGFLLADTMIYEVAGTGAKGSKRLYWQGFEFMFVFSKGPHAVFNPLTDRENKKSGGVNTRGRIAANGGQKDNKRRITGDFSKRTNVWRYHAGNNGDDRTGHPAVFPEALARDHILSWSHPGNLVLDPFMGSGTTGKMALLNGRNFLGMELSPKYFAIAWDRIYGGGQ